MRYLKKYGYDEIAINVHYLADAIVQRLGDGSEFGVRLSYLHEDVLLGSAGAVKQMEAFLSGGTFVVVGCDDLTDLPLDQLVAFHHANKAIATIGLVKREEVDQYGVVVTDPSGKITGFQEKPPKGTEASKLVNTGIYAFSPEIFKHIPAGEFYDFGKNVFPALQQAGAPFYGFDARGAYWCDIGTIPEYWRATIDVLEGRFKIPGGLAPNGSNVIVDPGARIDDGARIVGPSVISAGVHIARGAHVERSILWQGVSVGENAQLRGVVAGANYAVPAHTDLRDTVVAFE
jgi:NDP-sugar pyrophosphorylase family protein